MTRSFHHLRSFCRQTQQWYSATILPLLITDHIRARALMRNPRRNVFNRSFYLCYLHEWLAGTIWSVWKMTPVWWGVQCSPVAGQGPSLSHLTIYFYNSAYWRLAIVIQFAFSTLVLAFVKVRFKNAKKFRMCHQKSFNIGICNALGLMLKIWHFPFWFLLVKDDCFHC